MTETSSNPVDGAIMRHEDGRLGRYIGLVTYGGWDLTKDGDREFIYFPMVKPMSFGDDFLDEDENEEEKMADGWSLVGPSCKAIGED